MSYLTIDITDQTAFTNFVLDCTDALWEQYKEGVKKQIISRCWTIFKKTLVGKELLKKVRNKYLPVFLSYRSKAEYSHNNIFTESVDEFLHSLVSSTLIEKEFWRDKISSKTAMYLSREQQRYLANTYGSSSSARKKFIHEITEDEFKKLTKGE